MNINNRKNKVEEIKRKLLVDNAEHEGTCYLVGDCNRIGKVILRIGTT